MSRPVGVGTVLADGRVVNVAGRAPLPGDVSILNHTRPGDPWQQTLCDPTTCTLGDCALGGPYHQIPHKALIAQYAACDAYEAQVQAQMRMQAVAALAARGISAPATL